MMEGIWSDPVYAEEYIAGRVFSRADSHVLKRLEKIKPSTLIELGTGPGEVMKRAGFVENYISTDISMEFLTYLDSGTSVCCRGCRLPFRTASADCVLAMAVLHHLDCTRLHDALRETHRILKPRGILLLLEDWCFTSGATEFEEEARKVRFRHGTRENHLAWGTWLFELHRAKFACQSETWTDRPFHTSNERLLSWPRQERKVRMLCLESMKLQ